MTKKLPEINVVAAEPGLVVFEFFDGEKARRFKMRADVARRFGDEVVAMSRGASEREKAAAGEGGGMPFRSHGGF